jgi:phosphinothricin acetyltransferase
VGVAIRSANPADTDAIAAIYAYHVLHGTASFDTEPPDADFWRLKIEAIVSRGWPFLVVEQDGVVCGYAYANQFRDRPAYAGTCEDSIYVDHHCTGRGLGGKLLAALIAGAQASGFEQMIAVIGGAEPASVALHGRVGFVEAGRMLKVGRKFGRILDTLYMQRDLTS